MFEQTADQKVALSKEKLRQADEEISQTYSQAMAQIAKEKEMGIIQDPMAAMDAMGGEEGAVEGEAPPEGGGGGDLDSAFSSMISPDDYGKGNIW